MATDTNRVILIGRLTRDAEIKSIPSGTQICNLSIANNKSYIVNGEKKEDVSYFNCVVWGKGAEIFSKYSFKGQQISIEGRLQQRRWQDKDGGNRSVVEVVVDNFQFLSYRDNATQDKNELEKTTYAPPSTEQFDDKEIPF